MADQGRRIGDTWERVSLVQRSALDFPRARIMKHRNLRFGLDSRFYSATLACKRLMGRSSATNFRGWGVCAACRRPRQTSARVVFAGASTSCPRTSISRTRTPGRKMHTCSRRVGLPMRTCWSRLDGRAPCSAAAQTDLHVLGLFPQSLDAQCRAAHRSLADQCRRCVSRQGCGRRYLGSWTATCERPRADVVGSRRWLPPNLPQTKEVHSQETSDSQVIARSASGDLSTR